MAEPQVITSWDQLSPVVYDEAGVAVSTRVLAEQHRKLEQQVEALEAARFAYASEFDGDKESIHENIRKMKQQVEALSEKYSDLIMQVQVKIPNETRHETARRIIQQHENRRPIAATAQQGGEE